MLAEWSQILQYICTVEDYLKSKVQDERRHDEHRRLHVNMAHICLHMQQSTTVIDPVDSRLEHGAHDVMISEELL